jgi:hypothetical protein
MTVVVNLPIIPTTKENGGRGGGGWVNVSPLMCYSRTSYGRHGIPAGLWLVSTKFSISMYPCSTGMKHVVVEID